MLQKGDKAPAFKLKDTFGEEITSETYKGKWLVVYFYPKDNTPGCTKEACDFSDALEDFRGMDADVIGVSPDSEAKHKNFTDKYDLKVRLLADEEKTMLKAFGAWGLKKNYGKEYEGVIRSTFIIDPEGVVQQSWSNIKVRQKRKAGEVKHADIVREKLAQLQAGE